MDDKAKDILQEYRSSDAEGRLNIMMANFYVFPTNREPDGPIWIGIGVGYMVKKT